MNVIINPGSGPVETGTKEQSELNVKALIEDVKLECVYRFRSENNDGRHTYEIYHNNEVIEVEMPAILLDKVRYLGNEGQNIWHFPRLYVGGSSWVWLYAIDIIKETFLSRRRDLGISKPRNSTI